MQQPLSRVRTAGSFPPARSSVRGRSFPSIAKRRASCKAIASSPACFQIRRPRLASQPGLSTPLSRIHGQLELHGATPRTRGPIRRPSFAPIWRPPLAPVRRTIRYGRRRVAGQRVRHGTVEFLALVGQAARQTTNYARRVVPPDRSGRPICCVTIDNIGEAAEIGEGTWPTEAPLGNHFTVGVVEALLATLDRHCLTATFFVEALNAEIYPSLLRRITGAGHEVACHGWQHERWSALSDAAERRLLQRATEALAQVAPRPVGFRPPGGVVAERTEELLIELGYRYYSPAGSRPGLTGGLAVIPFRWRLVDAFFYAPSFAGMRQREGIGCGEPAGPTALVASVCRALRGAVASGSQITLLFHPLLLADPDRFAALDRVLHYVRDLVDCRALEVRTMRAVADAMVADPRGAGRPIVDPATWASRPAAADGGGTAQGTRSTSGLR